ncbi:MAG: glucose 1-dehydrogenase [Proteobacteria bacterium]|nr:glucose 1-dehydrogenase [Pseudomonadota bacterium]
MKLEGKSALVTGSGRGIGRAIAVELARAGCAVAVCDVRVEAAEETAATIESLGGRALAVKADISVKDDVLSAVEIVLATFKKIDTLVNNAGIYKLTPLEQISEEEWDSVMGVNVKGAFFFSQAVVGNMKERRTGRIINISSSAAISGGLLAGTHYTTSKAAIIGLTRSMARTLAPYGVLVNAIAPGRIDTPGITISTEEDEATIRRLIPLGRTGVPEDVARVTVFLASEDSSYITGAVINVSGGLQIP